jgi:hypothetical protein
VAIFTNLCQQRAGDQETDARAAAEDVRVGVLGQREF